MSTRYLPAALSERDRIAIDNEKIETLVIEAGQHVDAPNLTQPDHVAVHPNATPEDKAATERAFSSQLNAACAAGDGVAIAGTEVGPYPYKQEHRHD